MRGVRTCLLAIVAGLSLPAAAIAADAVATDLSAPAPADAAAPVHIWSGPYAGAFVGYNFSNFDRSAGPSFDGEGFVGGVYAGFNLQSDRLVYGIEGDVGASNLDAGGFNFATGAPVVGDSGAFGSLRGRVGVAYDPFLFFATAGVAVADKELASDGSSDENTHFGYTLGAGLEAEILPNVASRLEYRYSDFEAKDYDLGKTTVSSGFDEHSVRAGVALKF